MLAELDDLDSNSGWVPFFQKLNWIAKENAGSQKIAKLPENRQLNRYRDVLPYDHSRIILNAEDGNTDYINANFVESPSIGRKYILCQGPLKHTSAHFWQMVWEQNSKAVVMLNRVIEKNQIKCYQYWPCGEAVGHTNVLEFGNYRITYLDEKMSEFFTVKTLELYNIKVDEKRTIYHFHYLNWPDFGVPSSPGTFLSFLFEARNMGVLSNVEGPAVIHCSAGIGRSGTYIMVDCVLKEVEKTRDLNGVDMKKTLLDLRTYRLGLIQTPDQLRFTYAAILEGTHILFPEVYDEALDKFMESRDGNESEEEEPPPLPPPRKRPEDIENDQEPKRRKSLPDTPVEQGKGSRRKSLTEKVKGLFKSKKGNTEKSKGRQEFSSLQATLSSGESDGEDEIINLSDSSLSDEEDEEEETSKKPIDKNIEKVDGDSGTESREKTTKSSVNDGRLKGKPKSESDDDSHNVDGGKSTSKESSEIRKRKVSKDKKEESSKCEKDSPEKKEDNSEWVKTIVKRSLMVIAFCSIAFLAYRFYRYISRGPKMPRPRRPRRL